MSVVQAMAPKPHLDRQEAILIKSVLDLSLQTTPFVKMIIQFQGECKYFP